MTTALDHLVVAARTLDEGVRWCEATLGVTPAAGGKHGLMGTHNRVFSIASPQVPRAYFEIIAIDPLAPDPGRARWFDLDAVFMAAALAQGPQLIHWVLRCDDIEARCAGLRHIGIDRGEVLAAERESAHGTLRWRISVRGDGRRLCRGALPTLIQWADRHPADAMPASGVALQRLDVAGVPVDAAPLCAAPGVRFVAAGAPLVAVLSTPRGPVELPALTTEGEPDVQP